VLALKVISRLLDYPSEALFTHADDLVNAINESAQLSVEGKNQLVAFIRELTSSELYDAQERYDLLFDRGRSLSLLLFEHVHGESRDRGQAMVDLMKEYTDHGFEINSEQLPDYIPLYLEFLSEQDQPYAQEWLSDVSHILTILAERLRGRDCNYRVLFDAMIELSGAAVEREKLAKIVQKEQPDDTFEAIDKAWEDKEIRFDDPIESGSDQSCGYSSAPQEAPITWQERSDSSAA